MIMPLSNGDVIHLVSTISAEIIAIVVASRRCIWRSAPAFFGLLTSLLAQNLFLLYFLIYTSLRAYFYAYWYSEAVVASLFLAATIEVVGSLCRPGTIVPTSAFMVITNFAMACSAVISSAAAAMWQHGDSALHVYVSVEKSCSLIACSIMVAALLFSSIFTLRWEPLQAAIAIGILIGMLVPAAFNRIEVYFQTVHREIYVVVDAAALCAAIMIWIAGAIAPPRKEPLGYDIATLKEILLDAARERRDFEVMVG